MNVFYNILFIFMTVAMNSYSGEFFQNLIDKGKVLEWDEVKNAIGTTAREKKFLSFGETHLHKSSSGELNSMILKEYISQLSSFRICTERINGFWEIESAQEIINSSAMRRVNYYKLGLNTSKMNGCHLGLRRNEGMIVYSGLYHQYPFGRNYQELPSSTPVQRDVKKNIAYDLRGLEGLFISHFEIDYLLNMHLKGIVLSSKTYEQFNQKLMSFIGSINNLIKKFKPFTDRKDVLFIENDSFLKGKEKNKKHKKIFMISNLNLSSRGSLIHLYEAINKIDEKRKFLLFQLLKQSKFLVRSFYMEPSANREFPVFTFGNGHKFHGDFDYIQFLGPTRKGYAMFLESNPLANFRLLTPGKSGYIEQADSLNYLLYRSKIFQINSLDVSVRF